LWLIFIPKCLDAPQGMKANGPQRGSRPLFVKGALFYREGDEVRLCRSEGDAERVFRGFSAEHLAAYQYDVDEPYFRLLSPNWEKLMGRGAFIDELKLKLDLKNPVVALEVWGGVEKPAIAIQAVRELYEARTYDFIISLSAKSRVWIGHVRPRKAAF